MTGRNRRQTRQQVVDHQQRNPPAQKPANNRVWEQVTEKAAAAHPDARPLTVEFTALRLLEAMIRKDGRAALTNPDAVRDCVHSARVLLTEAMKP